jgi:DUF2075 family protein
MHVYSGDTSTFIDEADGGVIVDKISAKFAERFGHRPGQSEIRAWRGSLSEVGMLLRRERMTDHGIVVEMQLPLTSRRLDCLITGHDDAGRANAVIVELKQWNQVESSPIADCVTTFIGSGMRDVLHPSAQADGYRQYLQDTHTAFADGSVGLHSCAWLHNMRRHDAELLFDDRFAALVDVSPPYTADSLADLGGYLHGRLGEGDGMRVLERVVNGRYRPHKRLLEHVAETIAAHPTYILLDDQRVAFNHILTHVRAGQLRDERAVFLIRGGPGTGKSVIAVNLVGELARHGFTVNHATGSKAFTQTLRSAVGKRAAAVFSYYRNYATAEPDGLDVLVLDEAHRVRATSDNRFTKKVDRSGRPQVDELIHAARTTVFFIDDLQVVRPGEVGSSTLIRDAARRAGARLVEHELETQFRCAGSDLYVRWIATLLGLEEDGPINWDSEQEFDFDLVDSPQELEALIRMRDSEGFTGRLAAGFCWPWSNPQEDGSLVNDVVIDGWSMPWNAKPEVRRLAPGIPKADTWATEPGGVDQVGCIYTAQGFEYDYAGVIVGPDLVWRDGNGWVGRPEYSKDSVVTRRAKSSDYTFTDLVKHTYRVLLTRGLRGCYVYFADDETRQYVASKTRGGDPS